MGKSIVTAPAGANWFEISRDFAAPRALVWKMYTEVQHLVHFWGPKGGSVPRCDIDLRVGGKWRWVMVTPDGFEVAFNGEYREIVPHEKLVHTEIFEGVPTDPADAAVHTITLTEVSGRTHMVSVTELPNQEARDAVLATGMEAGMQDAYDLLEGVAVSLE